MAATLDQVWRRSQIPGARQLLHTEPPSTALNAAQVIWPIWRFCTAHPRARC